MPDALLVVQVKAPVVAREMGFFLVGEVLEDQNVVVENQTAVVEAFKLWDTGFGQVKHRPFEGRQLDDDDAVFTVVL